MNQRTLVIDPVHELPDEVHEHLERRYGADAAEVVAIAAADARLARPIVAGLPDLLAEAVFGARLQAGRQRRGLPPAANARRRPRRP